MRGILQAELVGAEGVTDILGNFEEGDLEQGFPTAGQYILLFLGEKQRAQRRAQRLLATAMSLELPKTWRQQVWHGLQYDSGEITADQYLSRARPNLTHEGRAYLHLALAALADGQRSAAREYFSQVLERIVPSDELYLWSQALLDRMQADPLWPPWIGVDVSSSTAPAE